MEWRSVRVTSVLRGVIPALATVLALSPGRVHAKMPDATPPRKAACGGLTGAAFGLCNAYLAQDCNVRPKPSCQELRANFQRITGLPEFPFDPTRTPTPTPTPTVTPTFTWTSTPTLSPTPPGPANECGAPDLAVGPHGGAIAIFPKIVVDAQRDTVIQLTNTTNLLHPVRCFYIDGTSPVTCREIDFDLRLTAQQPVQWTASAGRLGNPADPTDPGRVPEVPSPFIGELKCIEVDTAGAPIGLNGLTGEATLLGADGDVSKYDAITIRGLEVDADNVLRLDDVEYAACPARLDFTNQNDFAPDAVLGLGSVISNVLTLVPCTENIEDQVYPMTTVQFEATDELELRLSASRRFGCRYDEPLSSLFPAVGSSVVYVRMRTAFGLVCVGGPNSGNTCTSDADCLPGVCQPRSPVVGVLETLHTNAAQVGARAARNLQTCGGDPRGTMTLPLFP